MPYVKNYSYRDMDFSTETPKDEFYKYANVQELAAKSEMCKDDIFLCRTIGILHSTEGRFYMTDVDTPTIDPDKPKIRVSMAYLKNPAVSFPCPHAIQIFGSLQWKNRPVIFAKILQALTPPMALRVRHTMHAVTSIHQATSAVQDDNMEDFT
ncbi:uncharacterized protein LOC126382247 [Pectinophora gossypiella]|uniref:uncharacterized protein LOC126382247 n=1 Tax=Pectinophora gossypiella TaxID=13191 RepID=UPI00214E3B4D|nr:uncharacterized protein LOC126382247 [Pectinophora gossypiella]